MLQHARQAKGSWDADDVTSARNRKRVTDLLRRLLLYATFIFWSIVFVAPFLWMLSSSLKDDPQNIAVPPILIPNPARWQNYPEALTRLPWALFAYNSVIKYAVPSVIGTALSCSIVAYGFSRIQWKGRDVMFFICIGTMMIPFQVTMVPLFIIFRKLDWINTYMPLVVPSYFGVPYFIFMLRQFFLSIPQELSDAARIDGCSELGILTRIILPLAKPALAVVVLFRFIGIWNDYLGPLIYLNERDQMPIALGLDLLRQSLGDLGHDPNIYGHIMAINTCVVLPVLVIYFFTQKTFIEGVAVTGLKG
jgi:ABC-type glycerol-3-phosphate transport system permease component